MSNDRVCPKMGLWIVVTISLSRFGIADAKDEDLITLQRYDDVAGRIVQLGKSKTIGDFIRIADEIDRVVIVPKAADEMEFKKQRERKARLLLRALRAVYERIEPRFDPDDPKN